jgi:ATP-dependent DNA helicase RecQ
VEMVRSYAESRGCRRQLLLGYFGEPFQPPCGACDNCRRGAAPPAGGHGPFAVGDRVAHRSLGEGTVTGVEDGKLVVLFEDRGYATLDAGHVVAEGLLSVVGQAPG